MQIPIISAVVVPLIEDMVVCIADECEVWVVAIFVVATVVDSCVVVSTADIVEALVSVACVLSIEFVVDVCISIDASVDWNVEVIAEVGGILVVGDVGKVVSSVLG